MARGAVANVKWPLALNKASLNWSLLLFTFFLIEVKYSNSKWKIQYIAKLMEVNIPYWNNDNYLPMIPKELEQLEQALSPTPNNLLSTLPDCTEVSTDSKIRALRIIALYP